MRVQHNTKERTGCPGAGDEIALLFYSTLIYIPQAAQRNDTPKCR